MTLRRPPQWAQACKATVKLNSIRSPISRSLNVMHIRTWSRYTDELETVALVIRMRSRPSTSILIPQQQKNATAEYLTSPRYLTKLVPFHVFSADHDINRQGDCSIQLIIECLKQ